MTKIYLKTSVVFFTLIVFEVYSLHIILERAKVEFYNKNYLQKPTIYIRKWNRNGKHTLNIEATILHVWANNVTIKISFFEYLSNEYRPSFIELQNRLCEMLVRENFIGNMLIKSLNGTTCPLSPGNYHLNISMSSATQEFPNVWPFEKGRANIEIFHTEMKQRFFLGYVYATFLNN